MKIMLTLFLSLFMITACNDRGEQEIVVVPKDYTGYVLIIFNQKDGCPIKHEGKKRVYEIPSNGILKTQFNINEGWRDFPEYYFGTIAPENKIPSFVEFEKIPKNKRVGYMGATGTVKGRQGTERLRFCEFYIGTSSEIEKAQSFLEKLDITKL